MTSCGFSGTVSGILPSMRLMTPPMAPLPYSRLAGPLMISIRSAKLTSTPSAWSALWFETSVVPTPFCRIPTRLPVWPRTTGCPTPGPNDALLMPISPFRVSPRVLAASSSSASPAKTLIGCMVSEAVVPNGALTTISSMYW